jgi:hypothetical protein
MIQASFWYTMSDYRNGTKDLTRRVKWRVPPGEQFMGVDKMQGIPKGGHRIPLGPSTCISVEEEPVNEIVIRPFRKDDKFPDGEYEVVREGLPAFAGKEEKFVALLLKINRGLHEDSIIKRVRFNRVI